MLIFFSNLFVLYDVVQECTSREVLRVNWDSIKSINQWAHHHLIHENNYLCSSCKREKNTEKMNPQVVKKQMSLREMDQGGVMSGCSSGATQENFFISFGDPGSSHYNPPPQRPERPKNPPSKSRSAQKFHTQLAAAWEISDTLRQGSSHGWNY